MSLIVITIITCFNILVFFKVLLKLIKTKIIFYIFCKSVKTCSYYINAFKKWSTNFQNIFIKLRKSWQLLKTGWHNVLNKLKTHLKKESIKYFWKSLRKSFRKILSPKPDVVTFIGTRQYSIISSFYTKTCSQKGYAVFVLLPLNRGKKYGSNLAYFLNKRGSEATQRRVRK